MRDQLCYENLSRNLDSCRLWSSRCPQMGDCAGFLQGVFCLHWCRQNATESQQVKFRRQVSTHPYQIQTSQCCVHDAGRRGRCFNIAHYYIALQFFFFISPYMFSICTSVVTMLQSALAPQCCTLKVLKFGSISYRSKILSINFLINCHFRSFRQKKNVGKVQTLLIFQLLSFILPF